MFVPKRMLAASLLLLLGLGALSTVWAQTPRPLSEGDLIKLIDLQLDDAAILKRIQKGGVDFTDDQTTLDRLTKAGASAGVLGAVREAARARPALPNTARNVTYEDVRALLRAEVEEQDILDRLARSPTIFTLGAEQINELKKAGATEKLLEAMQGNRPSAAIGEVTDLAIILDCSGSMAEKTRDGLIKMDVAKRVVSKLLHDIPPGLNVTFLIYGHDTSLRCEAVKVVRPLSPLDIVRAERLIRTIQDLRPVGATPIAAALSAAGAELSKGRGPAGLVLISDGKETCGRNPSAESARLVKALKLSFGVNVIGFDVQPDERASLEEIARVGRGQYYNADSAAKLLSVVQSMSKTINVAARPAAPIATEEEPAPRREPISAAKPSSDPNQATPLRLGELVKGRVDSGSQTNRTHYWLCDLPAGEYMAVVDMERADHRSANIIGNLRWLGPNGEDKMGLGRLNQIDFRARSVAKFRLDSPQRGIIRVEADAMMDYELGLFEPTASLTVPFFRNTQRVTPIQLGDTFTSPILEYNAKNYAAYCSMTLPQGDYNVTVDYRRVDGARSNVQGEVQALDAHGELTTIIGRVNEIDARAVQTFKIALSEEQFMIFRVTASQRMKVTFKVIPVREP